MMDQALLRQLDELLGKDALSVDSATCDYLAQDIYSRELPAGLVLRPDSVEKLAAAVAVATRAGAAVLPRGGGMSYSGGYVPTEAHSVLLDLRELNRVLEINEQDMWVKVQAGVTWQRLHQALADRGLRTPYWGPLSGIHATVGGSLSQNSIFWGSGRHGCSAESVLSLQVVSSDGSLLDTGSAGIRNAGPFFRQHGPDLSGLFCGDCGALGIKATATLRLLPQYPGRACGTFAFDGYPALLTAMAEVSRQDLAMECFGFDPFLQQQRMRRESLGADAKNLMGVMKSAGSVGQALTAGARIARAGRGFLEDGTWSCHTMIEDRTQAGADERLQAVREIASDNGGRELPNSVPSVLRANPFGPLNNIIGPAGERWVPVHGIFPHSRGMEAMRTVTEFFRDREADLAEHRIGVGYLLATVGGNATVLEPVFFWPDGLQELHRRTVQPTHLRRIKGFADNPPARATVDGLRQDLIALFCDLGAAHLQLGKSYLYQKGLHRANWELIKALKGILDPDRRINPGVLDL